MPATPPERAGFVFSGWYTQKNGGGDAFDASYKVTKNITVYAWWVLRNKNSVGITITFEPNGGAWGDGSAATILIPVTPTSGIPIPAQNLTKAGSYFTGWNTEAGGTGDTTVYAQWSYNPNFPKYTVTFDSDNGAAEKQASPRLVRVSANGGNTMPATLPEKSGKLFSGWYTEKNGKGAVFSASFIVGADMIVYACWIDPPSGDLVTVTFDKNSTDAKAYDANPRVLIIKKGETIPPDKMPQDPYWEGRYIKNWTINKDGSGGEFNSWYVVNSDITVYTQWGLSTYTVKFNMNDADSTPISDQTIKHDTKISEPAKPIKNYFDFEGWYITRAAPLPDLKWDFTLNTVPGDMTLYARWEHPWGPGSHHKNRQQFRPCPEQGKLDRF